MSVDNFGVDITLEAGADLSAKQYYLMKLSSGKAAVCGLGEKAIGVLQNNPASGEAASVRILGISKCVSGASISSDASLKSDAAGKATTATPAYVNTYDSPDSETDEVVGSYTIGQAMEGASASDIFKIFVNHAGAIPATLL